MSVAGSRNSAGPAHGALGGWTEQPIVFQCAGEQLVGVLSLPATGGFDPAPFATLGVVIVVGGPQYRVGSHRQFVLLARHLAAAGFPALRFDVRGMGDSSGARHSFLEIAPDIGAAIDTLLTAQPALRGVVLCGLCDGASAALLYLHKHADPRVTGLVLANPWVRDERTRARTLVRHYYLRRLGDASFWTKLLRGQVDRDGLRDLWAHVRRGRAAPTGNDTGVSDENVAYPDRMAAALTRFAAPTLVVLSGQDYTAKEFLERCRDDTRWRRLLAAPWLVRVDLPRADHTFSAPDERRQLQAAVAGWLARVDPARPADP